MRVLENGYLIKEVGLESIYSLANLHKSAFSPGWGAHDFALFLQDNHMRLYGVFPNQAKPNQVREPVGFLLMRCVIDEAEIISIAVARRHRRKGLGLGMMDMAIDHLTDLGVKFLHLEVDESNKGAVELYQQLGFEIVGERHAYYKSASKAGQANGGDDSSSGVEFGKAKASNALMMRLSLEEEDE